MKALIDADIVVHRIGYTTEQEDAGIAVWRCKEMLSDCINVVNADSYQLWFSDTLENNFRLQIYPEYKANRIQPKPKHYDRLKEYMVKEWDARIAHNMEADDALGIAQEGRPEWEAGATGEYKTIICSIDKDLLQVPGLHYNFVKKEFQEVTPFEGIRYFYTQVLTGDSTDNIKGCIKIGPVKATQALLGKGTEAELYTKVVQLYLDQHKVHKPEMSEDEVIDYLLMTARVLKIKQEEEEGLWCPPVIHEDSSGESQRKNFPAMGERSDFKHLSEFN